MRTPKLRILGSVIFTSAPASVKAKPPPQCLASPPDVSYTIASLPVSVVQVRLSLTSAPAAMSDRVSASLKSMSRRREC